MNRKAQLLDELRRIEQETVARWASWDVGELEKIAISDSDRALAQRDLVGINPAFCVANRLTAGKRAAV